MHLSFKDDQLLEAETQALLGQGSGLASLEDSENPGVLAMGVFPRMEILTKENEKSGT